MNDDVRIGVIGCGHWGPNHIRVFSQLPGSRVTGAADSDQRRLAAVRNHYPYLRCTTDYRELLRQDDVDAVVVAVPTGAHYATTRDALAAGKHVLCEKPLSVTTAEANELTALAESANRVLMTGHVFLFNPGIRKLKDLVVGGEAGSVFYLRAVRANLGPIRGDVNSAYDLASHDIAIFNFILGGEPHSVSAVGAAFLRDGIEDLAFINLHYPDGILAHIHVSWLDPRKIREIVVVGDSKMIVWDELAHTGPIHIYDKGVIKEPYYEDFGEFQLLAREGDISIPRVQSEEPLKLQNAYFLDCVRSGTVELSGGRFSAGVVKTLEAVTESMHRRGSEVALCQ